ncbi:MAG TPA: ribonucleoside-triphosphate reductase, adenosylcobalamin-dependent, partial [Candidatus Ruthenibacterium merdigallinarum]|nr:ribonucleoside-triphosphate reductase, adenosylcobalamin-dependent [Candidatus Ruthenibacterium merdigallinarum]
RQVNGRWEIDRSIAHRQMSNNSIYYREKPTREKLHWHLQQMRYSGEPGWVNEEAGRRRRPNFNGCNPCGEILLDSHGLCNLTTVNVMAFVADGKLDVPALLEAQKLSARAGYRMTCRELEMHSWDVVQKRDRLIGCSLTGWQDMVNATNMSREAQIDLLEQLRGAAHTASADLAAHLGTKAPLLATTIKPEGTLSLLPTVSSGVHYSHSPYYVRRVRITAADPLCKVCEDLGYPVLPEVGQDPDDPTTKVVEFPVKAPAGRVKSDVSAIEQLENYKMFMQHYVDHNCSITVHVRNDEWDAVEQWVWDNWDDTVALSFLSYDDSFYELMPYEAIDEAEYQRRKNAMRPFNPSLLSRYEHEESELDVGDPECASGACPVR